MGQKSNVLTLRKSQVYLSNYKENSKDFLYVYLFLLSFEQMLKKRNLFLASSTLNFSQNKAYIQLGVFYRTAKILSYKKKSARGITTFKQGPLFTNSLNFFFKSIKLLKVNTIICKNTVLNRTLKQLKGLLWFFYTAFKRRSSALFPRRFNFFFDFVKISALFLTEKVKASFFIKILGEIFRVLRKNRHSKYLSFLKIFFSVLIFSKAPAMRKSTQNPIKGIKFLLNGKLKGKARSSTSCTILGQIPIQSLDKNVDFAKTHVFTSYGVFGLKLWVCR